MDVDPSSEDDYLLQRIVLNSEGEQVAAPGKRGRNQIKALPAEAPPTKKNKTSRPTTPILPADARVVQSPGKSSFRWDSDAPQTQDQIPPQITRDDHGGSFSWDIATTSNAPDRSHSTVLTPTILEPTLPPLTTPPNPNPLPAQHSPISTPEIAGSDRGPTPLEIIPFVSTMYLDGASPSDPRMPRTPMTEKVGPNTPDFNTGTPSMGGNPPLGGSQEASKPFGNLENTIGEAFNPYDTFSADRITTPAISSSSSPRVGTLGSGAGNATPETEDGGTPESNHTQPGELRTSTLPETTRRDPGSTSFSRETTTDKSDVEIYYDTLQPATPGPSSTEEKPDPSLEGDAIKPENLSYTRPLADVDSSSFCWGNVPPTHNPDKDMRPNKDDAFKSSHPSSPSPPRTLLPLTDTGNVVEVEGFAYKRLLESTGSNSFRWDGIPITRRLSHIETEETSLHPPHTLSSDSAPETPRADKDAMQTENLSPAVRRMELDSNSFRWDETPRPSEVDDDVRMGEDAPLSPQSHRLIASPNTPMDSVADAMEIERSHPERSIANPDNGSFHWENAPPTHDHRNTQVRRRPNSKHSNPLDQLTRRSPCIKGYGKQREEIQQHTHHPTVSRGSFTWDNSSIVPHHGHQPPPPPRTPSNPHSPHDPHPRARDVDVDMATLPGPSNHHRSALDEARERIVRLVGARGRMHADALTDVSLTTGETLLDTAIGHVAEAVLKSSEPITDMSLILSLVRQILLGVSRESTSSHSGISKPKLRGKRPEDALLMQFDVRAHARHLMHRKDYSSKIVAAEPYDVTNYEDERHPGPSVTNFLPDVSSVKSRWNRTLAFIFARDFVSSGKYSPQSVEEVQRAFSVHLIQLVKTYMSQTRTNPAEILAARDRERAAARESRRRKLHKRRSEACLKDPDLAVFHPLLSSTNFRLASEDESGNDGDDCVIANMPWRNPELTGFLRALDAVHLSTRFRDDKPTRGNWPRNRIPSYRKDLKTDPVPRLPKNFYEPRWLASRSEFDRAQLKFKPERTLVLSDRVKGIVNKFKHVKGRAPFPHV